MVVPLMTWMCVSWREQVNFQWDDDKVRFVLDQHAELDFYSASSLNQQSADRHVAPLGHIILIPSHDMNVCLVRVHAATYNANRIGGVMVRVLASIAVDRGFERKCFVDQWLSFFFWPLYCLPLRLGILKLFLHCFWSKSEYAYLHG
jgi:hypothetical protein